MAVIRCAFAALLLAGSATAAHAAPFLLTAAAESQLEAWLGAGNLAFTNVYSKSGGDTGATFHAAANGLGPTFTLLQATVGAQTWVIGGYNPLSWSSIDNYNLSPTNVQRTAFIFNLTTSELRRQKLTGDPFGSFGLGQTYNSSTYGPAFGEGNDLVAYPNLSGGYERAYSYGAGVYNQGDDGLISLENAGNYTTFQVGALETYTFSLAEEASAVPEPASLLLLGGGLVVVARVRSRRRSEAKPPTA
jgi:hypothetical protein